MQLGIVLPLKSKQISKSWDTTCAALKRTLDSLLQQSDQQFRIAIGGHEKPEFLSSAPYQHIVFVTVPIAPPDRSHPEFSHKHLIRDKNFKIAFAIDALKKTGDIDYWYQLDADDVLHIDFVNKIQVVDGHAGAVIEGGFIFYPHQKRAIGTQQMSQYCGSTSIIADQYMTLPAMLDDTTLTQIPWARYPHMAMANFFKDELNTTYLTLKEPLIGYMLATGDNISDKWRDSPLKVLKAALRPYLKGKIISKQMYQEFGIR